MIFTIIPVHNRIQLTRACLLSLQAQTYTCFEVYVVDDGSTDGTSEVIKNDFPMVTLLHGDGSLWWTGATNLGVRRVLEIAKADDYVLTLNNDTLLPADYFEILLREIGKHPKALIGSLALDSNNRNLVVEGGVHINWLNAKYTYHFKNRSYRELRAEGKSFYTPTVLPGRGTAIPVNVFRELGLYDEKVFPHYAADYDFSLRAKQAGYDLCVSFDLILYCFPKLSGIANTDERVSLSQAFRSFSSIRSGNNLAKRFQFGKRHAPRHLLLLYIIADTLRVILGTLVKRTKWSLR
jgi:GT2 family glycosyltransferase